MAKDVKGMVWETYKIGTFTFMRGQQVWISSVNNAENVPEIYVDHFFILPGDKEAKKFWKDINDHTDKATRFYLQTAQEASVSLKLRKVTELKMGFLVSDDKSEKDGTFAGLIIDYHTPGGYTKRTLASLGLCGDKIKRDTKINPGRDGGGNIDEVIKLRSKESLGEYHRIDLRLGEYAPPGWDGDVWLSFVTRETAATFSGMIITPSREEMQIVEYEVSKSKETDFVGFDLDSINYFKSKIASGTFKSGMDRLKQLQK